MTHFIWTILAVLLAMGCTQPLPPAPDRAPPEAMPAIRGRPVIVFATGLAPLSERFSNTRLIFTEAFSRLGYDFVLESMPWERALVAAQEGRVDGEAGRVRELRQLADLPRLLLVDVVVAAPRIYAWTGDPTVEIHSWKALAEESGLVGYLGGIKRTERLLTGQLPPDRLVRLRRPESGFAMLANDRLRFFVHGDRGTKRTEHPPQPGIRRAGVLETYYNYPYLNQRHRALVEPLSIQLRQLSQEQAFAHLFH